MQPQGPYGPQQPYNPQGPAPGAPGQIQYGPDGRPLPPAAGQSYPPGQPYPGAPGMPGAMPGQPGQPPQAGQPGSAPQAALPGQPPTPAYELPSHLRPAPGQPDNLPPPPDAPTTPYDFFMQPKPAPPVNPLPTKGKRMTGGMNPYLPQAPGRNKMSLLIGGAVAIIVVVLGIVMFAPQDPAAQQLLGIAQTQQEVARVCSDATSKAYYRATRNFAVTCSASVSANQTELLNYMKKQGFKYKSKELGLKANGSTDAKLKAASGASSYDDTFRLIMESQLTSYNRALTAQLGVSSGQNIREILNKSQKADELLIQMVKDTSDKTQAAD